ncbi:hypothetical protein FACS189483_03470 [Spirochaetia bacterium]|nr:hypothetical protein FACS189483_03470 [Spirochaetia bacterium]
MQSIWKLLDAEEPKQSDMIQLITDYAINILPYNDAAENLADKYLQQDRYKYTGRGD